MWVYSAERTKATTLHTQSVGAVPAPSFRKGTLRLEGQGLTPGCLLSLAGKAPEPRGAQPLRHTGPLAPLQPPAASLASGGS